MYGFPSSSKGVATMLLRISFGLALVFVGLAHYMQFSSFSLMVSDGLGPLEILGTLWSYVMPSLMILGGALLAVGVMKEIGVWAAGIALGSIPPGMILKTVLSGVDLSDMMPWAINAFIWLLVYVAVARGCDSACRDGCCAPVGSLPKPPMPSAAPKPVMAAPKPAPKPVAAAPKPTAKPSPAAAPAPSVSKTPAKKPVAAPKKK